MENAAKKQKLSISIDPKSSQYFWGTIFLILTIVGFLNTSISTGNFGFLWTILWWTTLILIFRPHLSKRILDSLKYSQKHLPSPGSLLMGVGKFLGVLVLLIIGYFLVRLIMGDVNPANVPLAELTLSDIGRTVLGFIFVLFWAKLIISVVFKED